MKTFFAEPAVEVIKFNTEDVITASAGGDEPPAYDPNDPSTWPLVMPCG